MRDLWEYISTNWRLSVRFWEETNLSFAAVGALIALPLTALVAAGWEIIWSNFALRVLVLLPGVFLLVMLLLVTPFRMWVMQKRKIDQLTAFPESVTIVDLAAVAESQYGWNFAEGASYHYNDFVGALRQAAHDGDLVLEGRLGCQNQPEHRKTHYPLRKIPKEHWETYIIEVPFYRFDDISNFSVTTYSYGQGVSGAGRYCDLRVTNRARAVAWLEKCAEQWKGTSAESFRQQQAATERWEAEMREQGFEAIGDPDSEQGTKWVKRTDEDKGG